MQVWTLHNAARYAFVPAQGPVILFETHGCHHLAANIETVDEVRSAFPGTSLGLGGRLLEQTEITILEVAVSCDCVSPSYFSKNYRKRFQRTPGAERERSTSPQASHQPC